MPVYAEYGGGVRLAVVMSPVMPEWDKGEFFAPLTEKLVAAGFRVRIFDTLSLLEDGPADFARLFDAWSRELEVLGEIELLAGSALGGCLAQTLLYRLGGVRAKKALLISAPSKADDRLNYRLGAMADLAGQRRLEEALMLLNRYVLPEGVQAASPMEDITGDRLNQCRRLEQGFGLLRDIDVTEQIRAYAGRLLHVYGEQSQLVRDVNVACGDHGGHARLEVKGGGMRPLQDDPDGVVRAVREHLEIAL
ncbi:alpha/beta hydrolase [Chromobacterium sp. ASV23]|uniref:alpha/beta hydrolase n=1 Tax=Chromobacterium sp. ASV23 TaxID=2795110 RepID=UPI0018EB492C|nr:alpha/beta hydrolase [Chromobacterium sp. ASV23]